jgi:RNA polymerase sigma-70 factor (ECF subfamily)
MNILFLILIREPSENIEDQLVTNQIQEDLLKMLQFLPLNQQEVIKLRFFDGLSFKEIADHTDMSINTLRKSTICFNQPEKNHG